MRRTLEALRARDRSRPHWPVGSTARPDADYTAMLRTLGARLTPPSRRRPYWSVFQNRRFLAAARTPKTAILRAFQRFRPLSPLDDDRSGRDKTASRPASRWDPRSGPGSDRAGT